MQQVFPNLLDQWHITKHQIYEAMCNLDLRKAFRSQSPRYRLISACGEACNNCFRGIVNKCGGCLIVAHVSPDGERRTLHRPHVPWYLCQLFHGPPTTTGIWLLELGATIWKIIMLCNFPLPYNGPPTRKDQGVEIKCSWNGRTLYISNINMQLIGTRKSYEQHWKRAVTTQVCIGCIVWDSCYNCVHFIWYN